MLQCNSRAYSAIPVPTMQTWHGRHGSATAFYLCPIFMMESNESHRKYCWTMSSLSWMHANLMTYRDSHHSEAPRPFHRCLQLFPLIPPFLSCLKKLVRYYSPHVAFLYLFHLSNSHLPRQIISLSCFKLTSTSCSGISWKNILIIPELRCF